MRSLVFFFLMNQRPPRSTRTATLFPYTTLFRSAHQPVCAALDHFNDSGFGFAPVFTVRLGEDTIAMQNLEHFPWRKKKIRSAIVAQQKAKAIAMRSEEHTSELQSLMRTSYAVFCLKKKKETTQTTLRTFVT